MKIPVHFMKFCLYKLKESQGPGFSKRQSVTQRFQPPVSPDLNLCRCYMLGTVQDRVYMDNPDYLPEWKHYIWEEIAYFLRWALWYVEKCFYNVKGLLRSQTLALLWDTSVKLGKMSCRVKMVSKYQVDTVFVCGTAVVTIAMLTDTVIFTQHL